MLKHSLTPKNCTITRRQRYFKTEHKCEYETLSPLFLMTAFGMSSIDNRTDEILHSGQRNWSSRFPTMTLDCCQCLRLCAGINSYSHNSQNVFSRRHLANLEANLPVKSNVQHCFSTRWLWPLMCMHEHRPAETIHHDCSKTALLQLIQCWSLRDWMQAFLIFRSISLM